MAVLQFTLKNRTDARRRGASSGAYFIRYVSSAATMATQQMGVFQRERANTAAALAASSGLENTGSPASSNILFLLWLYSPPGLHIITGFFNSAAASASIPISLSVRVGGPHNTIIMVVSYSVIVSFTAIT